MKKTLSIILAAILVLSLSSCQTNNKYNAGTEPSNGQENETQAPDTDEGTSSNLGNETQAPKLEPPVKRDNPRVDYTKEEVIDIINTCAGTNFTADENIHANVPKTIDHVSTFFRGTTPELPPKEAIEDFKAAFAYLFPGHEFDESCFYYIGPDSTLDVENRNQYGYKTVAESYDKIISGESVVNLFSYNESYGTYKEDRVNLVAQSPFGNTLTTVNKCVSIKLAYQMGLSSSPGSELFFPSEYFAYVGSFSPDSDEVFKLMDKEISIKDAVKFFEDYVNGWPCSIESYFSIRVTDVYVYKVKEDLYSYYFTLTQTYEGVPFDYAVPGGPGGRFNRELAYGGMIKSDDIDYIYGGCRTETVMEEELFPEIISFEEAVKIASEKMTEYVDFNVWWAGFVYCIDSDIGGSGKLGETKNPIFPAWKLMAYNPNDDNDYTCYVNALTGEFETYMGGL